MPKYNQKLPDTDFAMRLMSSYNDWTDQANIICRDLLNDDNLHSDDLAGLTCHWQWSLVLPDIHDQLYSQGRGKKAYGTISDLIQHLREIMDLFSKETRVTLYIEAYPQEKK